MDVVGVPGTASSITGGPRESAAIDEAVRRLTELAEGWECAALAEQGVMAKFQEAMERFTAKERSPEILRHARVYVDARSSRDRFEKDAAAIRFALTALGDGAQVASTTEADEVPGTEA